MVKIEITGIAKLEKNLNTLSNRMTKAVQRGVRTSTDNLYTQIRESMSGQISPGWFAGVSRNRTGTQGTGLEIPPLAYLSGAIFSRSGKMKSNLRTAVGTDTLGRIVGAVGYSRNFVPERPSLAIANQIRWPKQPLKVGIPYRHKKSKMPKHIRFPYYGKESVLKYVPIILLGDGKILGRNVLRAVLALDIQRSSTLKIIRREASAVIQAYK